MPRRDPKGERVRFHIWLYKKDLEDLRLYLGGRSTPNEVIRLMVNRKVAEIRQKIQDQLDQSPPPATPSDLAELIRDLPEPVT